MTDQLTDSSPCNQHHITIPSTKLILSSGTTCTRPYLVFAHNPFLVADLRCPPACYSNAANYITLGLLQPLSSSGDMLGLVLGACNFQRNKALAKRLVSISKPCSPPAGGRGASIFVVVSERKVRQTRRKKIRSRSAKIIHHQDSLANTRQ